MRRPVPLLLAFAAALLPLSADERGELIFTDDFERNEPQETFDEPGKGWTTT